MQLFWLADNDDDLVEDLEVDEGGGNKGSALLIGILIVNTLLILAAIVWFIFFYDKPVMTENRQTSAESKSEKEKSVSKELGKGPMVEMREFVVNLKGTSSDRYLKVNVAVEVDVPDAETELIEKRLVARDQVLVFLSGLDVDQTSGIEGKQDIKEGIIKRLNNILLKGRVRNVYFKDFVVQ